MKTKVCVLSILLFCCFFSFAQNCIDAIYFINESNNKIDTLFCKITEETADSYTIDNGNAVTVIPKKLVQSSDTCVREMTVYEVYKYEGLENVTRDYFKNQNTAGNALRKAAFNTYIATGLAALGGISVILGVTVFNDKPSKPVWIIGGSVVVATSLFFVVRGWNQIYKAGKLIDLNNNSALYIDATQNGDLGLVLKF